MQERYKVISWLVELQGLDSAAVLIPDRKGRILSHVIDAAVKAKKKFFTYYGVNLPHRAVREAGGKIAGLRIFNLPAPGPVNAHACLIDGPDQLRFAAHVANLYSLEKIPDTNPVAIGPGEPPLWTAGRLPDRPFQVRTRNCVDDDIIQQNLVHNLTLPINCLPACAAHGQTAVIVSAGPSLPNFLDRIREETLQPERKLVCVKHSHDMLLDAGIVPWACVLLDPRSHVKDFVENPHPEVRYFVSSTCNPTTLDRLMSRGANVWFYHALVGAGEKNMVALHNATIRRERERTTAMLRKSGLSPSEDEPFELADHLVSGGTTAASRGVSVLHMLGFRRFRGYAFDSCYWEQPDMSRKKDDGQPRYHSLKLAGQMWWTDAELVAQVQDFKAIVPSYRDCTFEFVGDGMVPALVNSMGRLNWQLDEVIG